MGPFATSKQQAPLNQKQQPRHENSRPNVAGRHSLDPGAQRLPGPNLGGPWPTGLHGPRRCKAPRSRLGFGLWRSLPCGCVLLLLFFCVCVCFVCLFVFCSPPPPVPLWLPHVETWRCGATNLGLLIGSKAFFTGNKKEAQPAKRVLSFDLSGSRRRKAWIST